jgi:serine O-acetyltransferase
MPEKTVISATEPDWKRESLDMGYFNPAKCILRAIRRYQRWKGKWGPVGWLVCKWCVVQNRFWGIITGCELPIAGKLGGGLLIPHAQGIIIHGESVIGPNCLILHHVTIGENGKDPGSPTLGGHVDVGAGAKILGPIKVGDHARIGANAVVLVDVPAGHTAVGVPARIIAPKT